MVPLYLFLSLPINYADHKVTPICDYLQSPHHFIGSQFISAKPRCSVTGTIRLPPSRTAVDPNKNILFLSLSLRFSMVDVLEGSQPSHFYRSRHVDVIEIRWGTFTWVNIFRFDSTGACGNMYSVLTVISSPSGWLRWSRRNSLGLGRTRFLIEIWLFFFITSARVSVGFKSSSVWNFRLVWNGWCATVTRLIHNWTLRTWRTI